MLKCHRASVNHINILWNVKKNHFARPWGVSHDDLKSHWRSQEQMGKNQRSRVKTNKQKTPSGDFPSGPVVKSLPLQGVWVQSPVGGSTWCVVWPKKQNTNPSVCACRDASRRRGLSLPCHPEIQKLLKFPFLQCSLEPFASGPPLPSETSCFSCSDTKLAGRWLNKNPHTPGLSVS